MGRAPKVQPAGCSWLSALPKRASMGPQRRVVPRMPLVEEMSEVVMGLKATWELSTVRVWADLSQTILLPREVRISIRRVTSVISGMF